MVSYLTRKTANLGLIQDSDKYIVDWMTSHPSLGPYPVSGQRTPRDIDKWSSQRSCISGRGMAVNRELGLYLCI